MLYIKLPNKLLRPSFCLAAEEFVAIIGMAEQKDCLLIWQTPPSVIFGRHQDMEAEVNIEYCRQNAIDCYRRKSGGGCVYSDEGNIMVSYITKDKNMQFAFHRFMTYLTLPLQKLGIDVKLSERNDLLVAENSDEEPKWRKISGCACYLHPCGYSIVHGTMLYDTRMENMLSAITPSKEKLQSKGVKSVRQRITLLKSRTKLTIPELKAHIAKTLCTEEKIFTEADLSAIKQIEESNESRITLNKAKMENKKTCLFDKHEALGALMAPFAGFNMPIQYKDIATEHNAVRENVGVFDVSHMGEVTVTGPEAEKFVNYIFTNDITAAPLGKIFYGMMLYETGGVVDDLLVYKRGEQDFFLVINAGNIDKDVEWIMKQAEQFDVKIDHQSDYYGQIAVQGPNAEKTVEIVLGLTCSDLTFYTFKNVETDGETIVVSRTGYTGEDGFEIYASHTLINKYWDLLVQAGVQPCGLGCRDTLRFEVGLPLYGDELSPEITPIMAGLGFFVKPDKGEFIGRDVCVKQKAEGPEQKIVGIELADKAIPRHGYNVLNMDDEVIGTVTTGYNSISTGKSVCMALINSAYSKLDTELKIQIRKKTFNGKVVKKQFYKKSYKN